MFIEVKDARVYSSDFDMYTHIGKCMINTNSILYITKTEDDNWTSVYLDTDRVLEVQISYSQLEKLIIPMKLITKEVI